MIRSYDMTNEAPSPTHPPPSPVHTSQNPKICCVCFPVICDNQGTGIDVFCGGSEALGAAALQALVAPTGGYVLIQPSFSEQQFASNLSKSIQEQSMSDGDGLHGERGREMYRDTEREGIGMFDRATKQEQKNDTYMYHVYLCVLC